MNVSEGEEENPGFPFRHYFQTRVYISRAKYLFAMAVFRRNHEEDGEFDICNGTIKNVSHYFHDYDVDISFSFRVILRIKKKKVV